MGAHSFLRVGEQLIFAVRESYSDNLAAAFQDSDGVPVNEPASYSTDVARMRQRLNALGFDRHACGEIVRACEVKARQYWSRSDPEWEPESFEDWVTEAEAKVLDSSSSLDDPPDWSWDCDARALLRLMIDNMDGSVEIELDLTEVVSREWVFTSPRFCEQARERSGNYGAGAPMIVLTEGRSDSDALDQALSVVAPHLIGFIRFLDFDYRPEGSASALQRTVRALAAAGVYNRVVALFDNDSAALDVLRSLHETQLPPNFRVVTLPELEWAKNYPTLGPNGKAKMDINGRAVSIELFFGRDVLTVDGELSPVQWTGYLPKLGQYQGEVSDKPLLQERFSKKAAAAKGHPSNVDPIQWADMRSLIDLLADAFTS